MDQNIQAEESLSSDEGELVEFVIVSIAPNGVILVWGDDTSRPYADRQSALRRAAEMRRHDWKAHPNAKPVAYKARAILGRPPEEH